MTSTYTREPTDVIDLTFDENGVKIEPEDDPKVTALSEDARQAALPLRFLQPCDEVADPSECVHTPPPKVQRRNVGTMSPPSVGRCTLTPMKPILGFG
jgi:hypothetical protein